MSETSGGESGPLNRWFVNDPAITTNVLLSARTAQQNSGQPQFVHHHPVGYGCSDACGFVAHSGGTSDA